jgi:DNA-binding MarR family transcriptional regulator
MKEVAVPARRPRTLVIRKAEQLRAMRTPLRQEILDGIERLGACSVKELASSLGREPASLYYHVHRLEEVGLVREKAARRTESVYQLSAPRILIDRNERSPAFLAALVDLYGAALRAAERELVRALESQGGTNRRLTGAALQRLTVRLTPKAAARLPKMIQELAEELSEEGGSDPAEVHSLTTVLARLSPSA